MSIVRIVVDELPESASRCFAAESHWNPLEIVEVVECKFKQVWTYMNYANFVTQRCNGCPLELEEQTKELPSDTQTDTAMYQSKHEEREDGDHVLQPEINCESSLTDELLKDRQSTEVLLARIAELKTENEHLEFMAENQSQRYARLFESTDKLSKLLKDHRERITELEKLVDQLIEAGRAITSVAEWRYANLTELLAWDTLVDNIYKERKNRE